MISIYIYRLFIRKTLLQAQESFVSIFVTGAIPRAVFGIGAANTLLPFLFCANDVKTRAANYQCDDNKNDNIRWCHTFTSLLAFFLAASREISRLRLIIRIARTAAKAATIAQPRIGIQIAPRVVPVKSVPKKYTKNPTE